MLERMGAAEFSDLVAAIYDCSLDPALWPSALRRVRDLLRCNNAVIQVTAMPYGRTLLNVADGVDQPWLDKMDRYNSDIAEIWGGSSFIAEVPIDRAYVATRIIPHPDVLFRNRYYLEWAQPQGLIDAMALILARDSTTIASLGMGRHESAGAFHDDDLQWAALVLPHLQRAVAIGRLFDMTRVARDSFAATLDVLTVPTFLTDRGMRLVHANQAGRALLDRRDPLILGGGLLGATSAIVARSLAVAVAQAAHEEANMARKGLGIPLRMADGSIGAAHVLPLQNSALRSGMATGAAAAIFVTGTAPSPAAATEIVRALFALTPTEARVFEEIAAGRSREEAAMKLGVSVVTVKTHLLRVYAKLDVKRQADIVLMAASLSVPTL